MAVETFSELIALWGNPAELAQDIGAKANTVSKWSQRNFVRSEWWNAIERAAVTRGFDGITVEMMADLAEQIRRKESAA